MTETLTEKQLLDRLLALPRNRRHVVAIAGAPGSGKSTVSENLISALDDAAPGRAAILPMDGYHYDDGLLRQMGLLARKGAPETFDVGGLAHMLKRLRANEEEAVAVPVFDRDIEISRAGARRIPASADILVAEGNYLLLDAPPWNELAQYFDLTVLVDVPEDELRRRLRERWAGYDMSKAEIDAKVEANDMPNGRRVISESRVPDLRLTNW